MFVTLHTLEKENTNIVVDNRPKFLKDAIYQGELSNAPYALSVSSPKIEPIDKRLLKANAHESMQHQAEQQISMLKKQAELLMKQAKEIEERLVVRTPFIKLISISNPSSMESTIYIKRKMVHNN